jgi:hypothetical protein
LAFAMRLFRNLFYLTQQAAEWKYYQGSSPINATIENEITKTNDSMLHVKVRNTNSKNIPVFQNLTAIFDYDMRYGSKQNQRIISRGTLGDAMKQILSWPYVLIHTTNEGNGNGFVDTQWDKPLIIRHNGLERHVFLHVDKCNQTINLTRSMPVKHGPLSISMRNSRKFGPAEDAVISPSYLPLIWP